MRFRQIVTGAKLIRFAGLAILLAGCTSSGMTEIPGTDAFDVSIKLSRDGTTPNADSVTVRIINHGTAVAYMPSCGLDVALSITRWDGTQWVLTGAAACPFAAGSSPVSLAPGDTLLFVRFLSDGGLYRGQVGVALEPALTDARPVTSNSVQISAHTLSP